MLTFEERIDTIEAFLTQIEFRYSNELATSAELNATVQEIWDHVDLIKTRIKAIENTANITGEILSTANGT